MRISDWSSDVCSSDLQADHHVGVGLLVLQPQHEALHAAVAHRQVGGEIADQAPQREQQRLVAFDLVAEFDAGIEVVRRRAAGQRVVAVRTEELRAGTGCVSTWISRWTAYY